MPTINPDETSRASIGGVTEVSALLLGDRLMWTQTTAKEYERPGQYTYYPPAWCNLISVIVVGGGGGGEAAFLVYPSSNGGSAGEVRHMHFTRNDKSPIAITVGKGGNRGIGLNNNSADVDPTFDGEPSSISIGGNTYSAAGGKIGAESGMRGGSTVSSPPSGSYGILNFHSRELSYSAGQGGVFQYDDAPRNSGSRGGGGSGATHRSLTGATKGGSGGDGYVQIVCFGVDPTIRRI